MTTLPMVLAEELGADWDRVHFEMSPDRSGLPEPSAALAIYGNSESTMSFFDLMRPVGASAREMLVAAAADRWHVAPTSCSVDRGAVLHNPSRRRLSFGQLAEAASKKLLHKSASQASIGMATPWQTATEGRYTF